MELCDKFFNRTAKEIHNISINANVMTEYHDIVIALWIISNHNPTHFFEVGTGTGGWPVTMHNVLSLNNTRFTLLEDMSWGISDFNYRGEPYPKNINELTQLIINKVNTEINLEVLQQVNLSTLPKYDTVRFDCDTSFEEFEEYINHCEENSIIFVDDFKFNISFKRVVYTMSLASKNKLFPLWFGDQESAWTTNKEYRDQLLKTMYSQIDQTKLLEVNPRVFNQGLITGTEWRYINSRGNSDLLFTSHKENTGKK